MDHAFTDIFPIPKITKICESFLRLENVPTALLDLEGNVHVAVGWQDICTKFHRVNPQTCARCRESDTALANALEKGNPYNLYRCKNGLVDVAVPVNIEGKQVGNFFTGQFFLDAPDREAFRQQANTFGFNEIEYLHALDRVPVHGEERVIEIVGFLSDLTALFGEFGLEKLRQIEAEQHQKRLLEEAVLERTQELESARSLAEKLASTDALTGVCNRRAFFERANVELRRAERNGKTLSLAMLDIDHFKRVNDTYGHDIGDLLLHDFAEAVGNEVRPSDLFARIGGEEFVVLLPETTLEGAVSLMERLRQKLANRTVAPVEARYTVSIGVCSVETSDTLGVALKHADAAMYDAKRAGRNQVRVYQSESRS